MVYRAPESFLFKEFFFLNEQLQFMNKGKENLPKIWSKTASLTFNVCFILSQSDCLNYIRLLRRWHQI